MDIYQEALQLHKKYHGKIDVISKVKTVNEHDLSLAYSPGVAEPCRHIAKNPELLNTFTARGNMIAVVSDGSAVLGLGNIGARAALPVMEGKCVLFRNFGGVYAFPLCLDSQDSNTIVETVKLMEPSFAGINLEDIAAPRCFEIEERLKKETNMLIFHDDQHGTAVVALGGLINALKITGRKLESTKVVVNGAGAAGISIIKLLGHLGVKNVVACDSKGIISEERNDLNPYKKEISKSTNPARLKGSLADALKGADVFIGVSVAGVLKPEMVSSMAEDPIIFALANPEPEIDPQAAIEEGASVVATGRSDYPNQVNNVLAFPGIFRGALDAQAKEINMDMKVAAARAIASIAEKQASTDYIIPKPFDIKVLPAVAESVARAAMESGSAPRDINLAQIREKAKKIMEIS